MVLVVDMQLVLENESGVVLLEFFGTECSYCCKHLVSEKEISLANLAASMY